RRLRLINVPDLLHKLRQRERSSDPIREVLELMQQDKYEAAFQRLQRLFEKDTTDYLCLQLLAICAVGCDHITEGLTALIDTLRTSTDWTEGWLLFARILAVLGDYTGAQNALEK